MADRTDDRPRRLLIVLPSWVGDAVMATPALRHIREALPGACIAGLVRPGIDEILDGGGSLDEVHVDRARGAMGPKRVAARLRPGRYDTALVLANSFSSALIARLAFIPRRIGYARDGRHLLLTHGVVAPRCANGRWAPVPAVVYYQNLAQVCAGHEPFLPERVDDPWWEHLAAVTHDCAMHLGVTEAQARAGEDVLARAGIARGEAFVLLNPGGNNPAKRWAPDRFALVGDHCAARGLRVCINAAPGEEDIARAIIAHARSSPVALQGMTLGALKHIAGAARLLVTNDTGPRHVAAALGTPVVTLFGPTDPRWTLIHAPAGERMIVADPTLGPDQIADEHPERCRVERIEPARVIAAVDDLLEG